MVTKETFYPKLQVLLECVTLHEMDKLKKALILNTIGYTFTTIIDSAGTAGMRFYIKIELDI